MSYDIVELVSVLKPKTFYVNNPANATIRFLILDSRYVVNPELSIFFALKGDLHDGHNFLEEVYNKGVRNFVVDSKSNIPDLLRDANVLVVDSPIEALHKLAAMHRQKFVNLMIIGITGSNGKTTIKEWLATLLCNHSTVRSPKSYNSQTGVPLSLCLIDTHHEIGVFEAGISQMGEMEKLQKMILPRIGIMTNIGDAHASGFQNMAEKVEEKLKLFKDCEYLIYEEDDLLIAQKVKKLSPKIKLISWGSEGTYISFLKTEKHQNFSRLFLTKEKMSMTIDVPFLDEASIQNVKHCITLLLFLDYSLEDIQTKVKDLHNLAMRLEMKQGDQNSIIINDTYNADLQSFKIALEFLNQNSLQREKVVFISSFDQSGKDHAQFLESVANLLVEYEVSQVYAIGEEMNDLPSFLPKNIFCRIISTTVETLASLPYLPIQNKAILVKGSRRFGLERLANVLAQKSHESVLETDLQAVGHNLRYYSSVLGQNTGIIAVIKASAYGSGSHELAAYLEFAKVDYLAVAYVDEGVSLRKAGIKTPIMVLNSSSEQWEECMVWNLEPEVYSLDYMKKLLVFECDKNLKVHIKVDTGMHRLGILIDEIPEAKKIVMQWPPNIMVGSIFTHLVSTEVEGHDDFTRKQVGLYQQAYNELQTVLAYKPAKHVLNTAGIKRFPEFQFDFVRIGLGLYGIDVTQENNALLEKVHTLKARVLQVKSVKEGLTVGYNMKGKVNKNGFVAILNIGYADGLMRSSGNGNFKVRIQNKLYPIIGNINMDLTIVDLGNTNTIMPGEEVEIFGKNVAVEELAKACQTIPYEILSRIAPRIKRVYIRS
ncbi:MAG: bifunctional UDP-N-acetylmuramoyl-tripeptide:D-alanyl-D-alanine ligase/alanine racemase [Saprospiraceae bacterium]